MLCFRVLHTWRNVKTIDHCSDAWLANKCLPKSYDYWIEVWQRKKYLVVKIGKYLAPDAHWSTLQMQISLMCTFLHNF